MSEAAVSYIREPITYEEFFEKYILKNQLCVIGPWLTNGWESRKNWVDKSSGKPDYKFLKTHYGSGMCPVADCGKEECGSHVKRDLTVAEYLDYMTGDTQQDESCLYLKDWHCVRSFPESEFYETPHYFTSDWLNEFWDQRSDKVCDDYRFVYIGPKGSWTPFHCDVLRSFSWSANICGRKQWLFYKPGEERHLCDVNGHLPYDLHSAEFKNNLKRFPNQNKVKALEVIQNWGETVFVPSSWHHQVLNLEDTISINHNWINGSNISNTWHFLCDLLQAVEQEISDCRGMDGWNKQCQLILQSTSGMDYLDFYIFLHTIAGNRITHIEQLLSESKNPDLQQTTSDTVTSDHLLKRTFPILKTRDLQGAAKNNEEKINLSSPNYKISHKVQFHPISRHLLKANFRESACKNKMAGVRDANGRAKSHNKRDNACKTHDSMQSPNKKTNDKIQASDQDQTIDGETNEIIETSVPKTQEECCKNEEKTPSTVLNHLYFDLVQIKHVLSLMLNNTDFRNLLVENTSIDLDSAVDSKCESEHDTSSGEREEKCAKLTLNLQSTEFLLESISKCLSVCNLN